MKKIDIDSLLEIRLVSSPRFSPDGRFAAFLLRRPCLEENAYRSDLYLLERDSMSFFALTSSGKVGDFCWSGAETILFSADLDPAYRSLRENDPEFSAYYEIHVAGGEAQEAFCLPLPVIELRPLGAELYLLRTFCRMDRMDFYRLYPRERQDQARAYRESCCDVFEDYPCLGDGQGDISARRMGLWLYDRAGGGLTPLTAPDFSVSGWDCRGDQLLYAGVAYGRQAKPANEGVYLRSLKGGGVRCLAEPNKWAVGCLGFLGEGIYLTETDVWPGLGYPRLWFADPDTLRFSPVTEFDCGVGSSSVACDSQALDGRLACCWGGRLYFCTTVDEEGCVCSVDRNGNVRREVCTRGACGGFDVFDGHILWTGQRDCGLQELYLDQRQITSFNQGFLSSHRAVRPERFCCKTPDGTEIRGYAIPPAEYRPDRRYPAVLTIHGGPRAAFSDVFFHEMQTLASRGYFVFFCNPRGSDGRGADFANIRGRYGAVDYEDLMAFLDGVLAAYPAADPDRLAVMGGSYGGFMTNWIIGHTDRFACAVSMRSVSNWITLEFLSDIGEMFVRREMGAAAGTDPMELWRRSPLGYAQNVKTPTLFIHSDQDFRCHMAESVAMYSALIQSGVEARLCLIEGESHGLSRSGRPLQRITRMEKMLEWLDAHLTESGEGRELYPPFQETIH